MSYYAYQRPRGFANEVNVYVFRSRRQRDAWVDEHKDDGDVDSANLGGKVCTAREAHRLLGASDDETTKYYNQYIVMG